MAQRTIHMLFGILLLDKIELFDKNRFLIGSVLPDAYINPTDRKVAHFIKYILREFSGFGWGMDDFITGEYYSIPWIEEK